MKEKIFAIIMQKKSTWQNLISFHDKNSQCLRIKRTFKLSQYDKKKSMYKKQITNILHGAILNAFALKSKQSKITSSKFKMTITTFILMLYSKLQLVQ